MCIKQLPLIYDFFNIINSSSFLRKYNAIFSALDLTGFHDKNIHIGCTGYSRHAILRALIVKHLEEIKSIARLIEFLDTNPILVSMCGFSVGHLPDESVFYRFLKKTNNHSIKKLLTKTVQKLIDVTNDPRSPVQRNSVLFFTTYKTRQNIEQYFARLGDREVDQTTHFSYNSIKNQISIAHLSMALVALAAVNINKKDKILCYRSFAA